MSTIKEVLDRVDARKPNAFTADQKTAWLSELEGLIALNVFLMDISEAEQFRYAHPEAQYTQLLVRFPHDCLYELWLEAKIDMANGEYDKYQNAMIQYNEAYSNFVKWFARVYAPAQGCADPCPAPGVPVYYITAYGLAVMQGFSGTLDEWLVSLKGEKGDYAVPIDTSLTKAGNAADAAAVGENFTKTKEIVRQLAEKVEAAKTAVDNLTPLDTTLKTPGKAADAAAVGAALAEKNKLLWLNDSPGSSFGEKTVLLDLSNVSFVAVASIYGTIILQKGQMGVWGFHDPNNVYTRAVTVTEDGVQFGECIRNGAEAANDIMVPQSIWKWG